MKELTIADWIGIYWAIVGSVAFFWEILQAYLKRKNIKIVGSLKIVLVKDESLWWNRAKDCISAVVTNESDRNCVVQTLWFIDKNWNKMSHMRPDFPQKIEPGAGYSFDFYEEHIGAQWKDKILNCRRIEALTSDNKIWRSQKNPYEKFITK